MTDIEACDLFTYIKENRSLVFILISRCTFIYDIKNRVIIIFSYYDFDKVGTTIDTGLTRIGG